MPADDLLEGYHPTFWEMWATFNLFREFGFTRDDIYVFDAKSAQPGPAFGKVCAFVALRTQGKECNVVCGLLPDNMDRQTFEATWAAFAEDLPKVSSSFTLTMWRQSNAYREKVIALNVLMSKGFRLPIGSN